MIKLICLLLSMCFFAIWILRGLWSIGRHLLVIAMFALAFLAYVGLGSAQDLFSYYDINTKTAEMSEQIRSPQGQQLLLTRLGKITQQHPDDAQGWYWLGRVYFGMKDYSTAQSDFAQAYKLAPELPLIAYELAQANYMVAGQKLDDNTTKILQSILRTNPYQKQTLNLLAEAAYHNQAYRDAYRYWHLLGDHQDLSDQDEQLIQQRLTDLHAYPSADKPAYQLVVSMPKCLPEQGVGFLVVESQQKGMPPLLATKIDFASLASSYSLTDLDQMLPMINLSDYKSVRVGVIASSHGRVPTGVRSWLAFAEHSLYDHSKINLSCSKT